MLDTASSGRELSHNKKKNEDDAIEIDDSPLSSAAVYRIGLVSLKRRSSGMMDKMCPSS